jgi:hypothetical protein
MAAPYLENAFPGTALSWAVPADADAGAIMQKNNSAGAIQPLT